MIKTSVSDGINTINDWDNFFSPLKTTLSFVNLMNTIDELYQKKIIYPQKEHIFQVFKNTAPSKIQIVIIGQDPYHQENQAHGLAFSVQKGEKIPPSLHNIFKEISTDIGHPMLRKEGDLSYLSKQGVFLLNTLLTVEANKPLSHQGIGYEFFMEALFTFLNQLDQPIVFMLWGQQAKKYEKFITHPSRLILTAFHPSPLSANRGGWFGCQHFSKANTYLTLHGLKKINWIN